MENEQTLNTPLLPLQEGVKTVSPGPSASPGADTGFSRKASGLVRSWSPADMWIYNVLAMNPVVMAALTFTLMLVTYPHASLPLAAVIAGLFCTAEAFVYAVVVSAMPRSGGDYVIQSRVFGGAVGSLFGFSAVAVGGLIWMALAGWFGAVLILSPFATLLGAEYHATWLVNAGSWFGTPLGIFTVGTAVIIWGAVVNIRGMRFYALLQRWFFWLGALLLGIVLVVFLTTSHATFVHNLNSFMAANYHVHDAYGAVIAQAGAGQSFSFSLSASVLAAVIAAFSLIYPAWSVQQAGEIRRAGSLRANLIGIVGAEVFTFALIAVISGLLVSKVGAHFLYSAGTLYYNTPAKSPLPVAPFFGFFIGLMSTSPLLTWLGLLMFFLWFWMWFPNITLGGTRVMMAMAFDRVLPEPVGRVARRSHAPEIAIGAFSVGCLGLLALYAFIPTFFKLTLSLTMLNITAFGVSVAAGGLFPWLKRDLYETSEARGWAVARVPVVTILAVIFVAFAVWVDYRSLFAPELGLNGAPGLIFIGGVYVFSIAVYLGARVYRRRRDGLDLNAVYKSLPTE